jgi:hypothetical protein
VQRTQQMQPQKTQNVCIDPSFSLFETVIIQDAFESWTQYTKVKYNYTNGEGNCYFKVYSVDEALATEAGVPKGIVAFCNEICGNQIFVLYERIPLAFYGTIIRHEIGHLVGLEHSEDSDDLMYYRVSKIKFPTQENSLKITCNK